MNNEEITYCTRCGSPMNINSRYCMKCGNLNDKHPENDKYSKIMKKTNNQPTTYQIGSGQAINDTATTTSTTTGANVVSNKSHNRTSFIIFNLAVIIAFTLIVISPLFSMELTLDNVINSGVLNYFLFEGLFLLLFICMQIIFIKMDEYWWSSLIPIYNGYLMCKKLFNNGWVYLLILVPGVNIIFSFVMLYVLGKSFGKNGILTVLFAPIMLLNIAFGVATFKNTYYVSDNSNKGLEKSYRAYKNFGEFSVLLILVGIVGFILTGNNLEILGKSKDGVLMVSWSNVAVKKVEDSISSGKAKCYYNDEEVSIKENGVYYFYSNDFLFEYGVRSNLIDDSDGYIKVINNGGKYDYYITFSAGNIGVKETNIKDLKITDVEKKVEIIKPDAVLCDLK